MIFGEPSWMFAREKCLAQGADLITFNSQEELVKMVLVKVFFSKISDIYDSGMGCVQVHQKPYSRHLFVRRFN